MRKLESIRADLDVNQDEMAVLLQMSKSAYAKKEQGRSPLLAEELKDISRISGVPMEEIEIPRTRLREKTKTK